MKLLLVFLFSFSVFAGPTLIAHKGSWKDFKFPVNTIKSFQYAFRSGFTGVELDVRLSKDNVLVVSHDDKLNFTTNCKKKISMHVWNEIRNCTKYKSTTLAATGLGRKKTKFTDKLSNLDEVFDTFVFNDEVEYFFIDVKDTDLVKLQQAFIKIFTKYNRHEKIVVINKNPSFLIWIKNNYPEIKTALGGKRGSEPLINFPKFIHSVGLTHDFVSLNLGLPMGHESLFKLFGKKKRIKKHLKKFLQVKKQKGFTAFVWTINKDRSFELIKDSNFEFILTDRLFDDIPTDFKR
jgi:glycerophosphoryl diester phosphodiesterase